MSPISVNSSLASIHEKLGAVRSELNDRLNSLQRGVVHDRNLISNYEKAEVRSSLYGSLIEQHGSKANYASKIEYENFDVDAIASTLKKVRNRFKTAVNRQNNLDTNYNTTQQIDLEAIVSELTTEVNTAETKLKTSQANLDLAVEQRADTQANLDSLDASISKTNTKLSTNKANIKSTNTEIENTNTALVQNQTSIDDKNTEIKDLNLALVQNQTNIDDKNTEIKNQKSKITVNQAAQDSKNLEIDVKISELTKNQSVINDKNKEISSQNTLLTDNQSAIDIKNEKISGQNLLLVNNQVALEKKNTEVSDQKVLISDNQVLIEDLDVTITGLNTTITGLNTQIKDIDGQIADLDPKADDYLDQLDTLSASRKKLITNLDASTEVLSIANTNLEEKQVIASNLNDDLNTLNSELTGLTDARTVLTEGLSNLNTELTVLTDTRKTLQSEMDALNSELAVLNTQRTDLLSSLSDLNDDLNSLANAKVTLDADLGVMTSELTSLNNQRANLTEELSKLKAQLSNLNSEKVALTEDLSNLNTELKKLGKERKSLKADLANLQSRRNEEQSIANDQDAKILNLTEVRDDKQAILDDFTGQLDVASSNLNQFLTEKEKLEKGLKRDQGFINTKVNYVDDYMSKENFVGEFDKFTVDRTSADNGSGAINLAALSVGTDRRGELNGENLDTFTIDGIARLNVAIKEVSNWKQGDGERVVSGDTILHFYQGQKSTADKIKAREELLDIERQSKVLDKLIEEEQNLQIVASMVEEHNATTNTFLALSTQSSASMSSGYINQMNNQSFSSKSYGFQRQSGYNLSSSSGKNEFGSNKFA